MAIDVRQFLKSMKFSDADIEAMAPKFGAEQLTELEAGYVGPDEKARIAASRTEIDAKQTALTSAEDKLNRDILEWAQLSDTEKARATELQAQLEQSQQDALKARQALTRVAEQAGIDPKTVMPEAAVVPAKVVVDPPVIDQSKFVAADQYSRMTSYMADVTAALPYIAQQHFELTGKHLDTRTVMVEIKKRAASKNPGNMDPVAIWEETHNIPQIRAERETAARAAEIAAAEARGEERARTNLSIPGADTTSHSRRPSPVLHPVRSDDGRMHARQSVLKRPQGTETVMRAAASLRSGKYAQSREKQPA